MSDNSLTESTRANLLATQKTKALIDRTSLRLSTGKRVNEPTDNVRAFVLAKTLTNQAGNLLSVKESIGQSLSAVGGALSGAGCSGPAGRDAQGLFAQVIDISAFTSNDAYIAQVTGLIDRLKATPVAECAKEIRIPGEHSAATKSERLTGGIYSRRPSHLDMAREQFRVGNLYLTRPCTGALVGRQPFGGFALSGVGSKAGGCDYLSQFTVPRAVCENTMRRGFAPPPDEVN